MENAIQIRQALETLRHQNDRFAPEVLATVSAVLEAQLLAIADDSMLLSEGVRKATIERRLVTVLFAGVTGTTRYGPDGRISPEARDLWRRIDQTILAHGGTIDKHMGDVVMAVFGVPTAAENDAERAVRCALAIAQLVQVSQGGSGTPAGLTMRAGINTGLVSVGKVGSDGESTVIGDAVNVASRLQELAEPDSVIVGESTLRLVETLYETEGLGPQPIKGRQTAVNTYRVTATRPRVFFAGGHTIGGRATSLVGRAAELDTLRTAVLQAKETGQGQLVLITGEAGIGKSRLAGELNDWLQADFTEAEVFRGRSDQRLQGTPFSLLRDLFTGYFNILESDATDVAEARLMAALQTLRRERGSIQSWPRQFRERARAVARLMGLNLLPVADRAKTGSRQPNNSQAKNDILEFFGLMATSHGAVVTFLEDIHWADSDSLDLIEKLGQMAEDTNLVVIALARPQLFDYRPSWLFEESWRQRRLALQPLPPAASHLLAVEILQDLPEVPNDLINAIVQSAGGNPFYMEELVKVLVGDEIIRNENGAWQMGSLPLQHLRIPDTLVGVLQARLDRLPPRDRLTLQQAAVVGDEFWDGSIQHTNRSARDPLLHEEVVDALRSLEEHDMIYRIPLSAFADVQAFRFRHSALREVAYESILLRDRPFYHLAAAEWLEDHSGDRLAEHAAQIAEHFELAGNIEHAATLYEMAARQAESQHRPDRAADHFGRALGLVRQLPQYAHWRLSLLRPLGRALLAKGDTDSALDTYLTMEQAAEEAGDLLERARAALAQAGIYQTLQQPDQMLAAAERAAQAATLTGAVAEQQQALAAQEEARQALGNWPLDKGSFDDNQPE